MSEAIDHREYDPVLATWYQGAWGWSHTWIVYAPKRRSGRSDYFVEHVPAAGYDDACEVLKKYPDGHPWIRHATVDKETAEEWLKGGFVPIPLVAVPSSGLDGHRRGVEIAPANYSGGANLSWWGDGPAEWAPLIRWVEELQERLHRHLYPEEETYSRHY